MLEDREGALDGVEDATDDVTEIGQLFRVECRSEQLVEALNQHRRSQKVFFDETNHHLPARSASLILLNHPLPRSPLIRHPPEHKFLELLLGLHRQDIVTISQGEHIGIKPIDMFDAFLVVEEETCLFLLLPQPDHPHHLPRAETGSPYLRVAPHQHAGSLPVAAEQHSVVYLVVLLDRLICFLR